MPSSPTSLTAGFLTKKEACRIYNRSHRQLTRDIGTAMTAKDERVLENVLLRTEDGESRDGIEVTTDLISTLRTEGLNPMWYVRAAWMENTFGKRLDPKRARQEETMAEPIEEKADSFGKAPEIVDLLRHQIQELERDKTELREELKIKNGQIRESSERAKETNVLTRDLHRLMMDLQQRLLPLPEGATPTREKVVSEGSSDAKDAEPVQETIVVETTERQSREQGSAASPDVSGVVKQPSEEATPERLKEAAEPKGKTKGKAARPTRRRPTQKGSSKKRTTTSRKKSPMVNASKKPASKARGIFSRFRPPFFPR